MTNYYKDGFFFKLDGKNTYGTYQNHWWHLTRNPSVNPTVMKELGKLLYYWENIHEKSQIYTDMV